MNLDLSPHGTGPSNLGSSGIIPSKQDPASATHSALRPHIGYALFLGIVLSACTLHPLIPTVVIVGCGAAILISPYRALQALTLLAVVRYLNPTLVSFDSSFAILGWVVLVLAAMRYGPGILRKLPPTSALLICFAAILLAVSPIVSPAPFVSELKLLSFTIIALTLLAIAQKTSAQDREKFLSWYYSLTAVVLAISIPFYFLPEIGFAVNGTGFQGILNHPQAFAVFFAPIASCLAIKIGFSRKKNWYDFAFIVFLVASIALSQARTAALAVAFSVTLVSTVLLFRGKGGFLVAQKRKAIIFGLAAVALGSSVLLFVPSAQDLALNFVFKHEAQTVEEALETRSGGVESQLENFLKSPILGNGFGVPADGHFRSGVVEVFGLPISAPVEKGFLPTAILEETGVLGTALFFWWLLFAFHLACKGRSGVFEALFAAAFFVNFGEFSFFSVNSLGLLNFALIGVAVAHGSAFAPALSK